MKSPNLPNPFPTPKPTVQAPTAKLPSAVKAPKPPKIKSIEDLKNHVKMKGY